MSIAHYGFMHQQQSVRFHFQLPSKQIQGLQSQKGNFLNVWYLSPKIGTIFNIKKKQDDNSEKIWTGLLRAKYFDKSPALGSRTL